MKKNSILYSQIFITITNFGGPVHPPPEIDAHGYISRRLQLIGHIAHKSGSIPANYLIYCVRDSVPSSLLDEVSTRSAHCTKSSTTRTSVPPSPFNWQWTALCGDRTLRPSRGGSKEGPGGAARLKFLVPCLCPPPPSKKVQDKAHLIQVQIVELPGANPVDQRESTSCVPPDESVATPVAPKMKTPEPPLRPSQSLVDYDDDNDGQRLSM